MPATLEYLAPEDLLVDLNIRTDLHLTPDFIASIRELGVLVPVVALRCHDGIRVRAGNRRTVAAIEAGLARIPVMVLDDTDVDTERIVEQLAENTQRAPLTSADILSAVEQLSLLGVSPATIAKRTRLPKDRVHDALAAAGSTAVREAVAERPALSLEHAGWLAEFDDDPQLRDRLLADFTGDIAHDRHAVERARTARRDRQAREAVAEQLRAEYPDATWHEGSVYDTPADWLYNLLDGDGQPLTSDTHQACPGHAFNLGYPLWETGEARDDVDIRSHDGVAFRIGWLCTDPATHGHPRRYGAAKSPRASTDDEQASAARRRTIALNRAGGAALNVRRDWLMDFSARKTPPKDAPAFMWAGLARRHVAAVQDVDNGLHKLATVLGLPDPKASPAAFDTWLARQSQATLAHLALCARLWAYEHRCDKSIWRDTGPARDYLRALESWGYTLSQVEQVCTGDLTEEQAHTLIGDAT